MCALTKTGIRILSAKYRSILIKCAIINAGAIIGIFGTAPSLAADMTWGGLLLKVGLAHGDDTIIIPNSIISDGAKFDIAKTITLQGENNISLSGNDMYQGLNVVNGGELTLQDIIMQDFTVAITNKEGTTTNLNNIIFANNTTDIQNDGMLNLSGFNNIDTIIGAGTTTIINGWDDTIVNTTLQQDNLINNASLIVSADALKVKNGIINNKSIDLTGGTLVSNISGNGSIQIANDKVINNADIFNNIGNSSELENNGNIGNSQLINFMGSSLVNNNSITTDYLGNAGTVENSGNIEVEGDELKNDLGVLIMNEGSSIIGNIYGGTINSNGTNTVIGSIQDGESMPTNLYLNDGTLNMSGEISVSSTTANGGSLGFIDDNIATANLGNLSLDNTMNISIDAHLAKKEIDTIKLTGISGDATINISDIRILSDGASDSLSLFTETIPENVTGNLTGLSGPVFMYNADYDDGKINFTRTGAHPYLYAPSVVANTTAAMTTQIATLAMDKMDDVVHTQGRSGGDTQSSSNVWVKVMGLNDNVEFNNFENIDSKVMTVTAGYNTNKITCGDCGIVFGAYAGYIGGKQQYTANDIDQDGGYVGLSSALTLGDAFLTATVNGGLLNNKANNMYGTDRFNTRWLGAGLKTGYNFAITDSVVLQPNMYGGYTLVNTQDYTSVSGVKIATNNLNFFEIDPGLKLSAVIADGWTGSIQGKYAIVMDNGANITANDIALQNISTKNYIEYGIGIDKSLTDTFYLGARVNRHDGGRTGWNGSIEFRYKF